MEGSVHLVGDGRRRPGPRPRRSRRQLAPPLLLRARGGGAARGARARSLRAPASATCSSATTASASRSPSGWRERALPRRRRRRRLRHPRHGPRLRARRRLGRGRAARCRADAGEPPGTLSLIEPELDDVEPALDAHGMDPVKVLALARDARRRRCRGRSWSPARRETVMTGEEEDVVAELSAPVRAALDAGRRAGRVAAARVDVNRTQRRSPMKSSSWSRCWPCSPSIGAACSCSCPRSGAT